MAATDPVRRVSPDMRVEGDPTPGMVREQAVATEGLWSGLTRTEPHMASGWHHHGDNDTIVYVVSGTLRLEFGADGAEVVEAGPGDFVHVPKEAIHRESNPDDREGHLVIVRAGHGPPTTNVSGPAGG